MIIVAAGQAERERALTNSQALVDELEPDRSEISNRRRHLLA
jgi:hypothetical protein